MKRIFRFDILLIVVVSLIQSFSLAVVHAAENGSFAGLVGIGSGRKMYLNVPAKDRLLWS